MRKQCAIYWTFGEKEYKFEVIVIDMITKKILLINPPNREIRNTYPHSGLASLASILKKRGHEVLVLDYIFSPNIPQIQHFITTYKPDVVGISLFTASKNNADAVINEILKLVNIPIIVGGAHASLYYEDLANDNRLDYIIRGEGELLIIEIIEKAKKEEKPKIINTDLLVNVEKIPLPDYTLFYEYEKIEDYPLLTSRGCPYGCTYCCVRFVSSQRWRPRETKQCIEEIKKAKMDLPNLKGIEIMDDNPSFRLEHLKEFLRIFNKEKFELNFAIANLRADSIDSDILILLKEANCRHLALGVEHGNKEIFENIKKGESLDIIKSAGKLIKDTSIKLSCCFIIGLPGDSLERTRESILFAKELNADHCFWNTFIPYKGTEIRKYFDEKGIIINEIGHPTIYSGTSNTICIEPCAPTPEFSAEKQKKAFVMAMLETHNYPMKLIFKLLPYAVKYRLFWEFLYFILGKIRGVLRNGKME